MLKEMTFPDSLVILMAPLSHNEVLLRVCGICLRKEKNLENISATYLLLIQSHHHSNYNLTSGDYSKKICSSCKRILRDKKNEKEKGEISKRKLPEANYHTLRGTRASRSQQSCQCYLCNIWRLNAGGQAYKSYHDEVRDKPGRPREKEPEPEPEVKDICQRCGGERKQGVLHNCNMSSLEANTMKAGENILQLIMKGK